MHSSALGFQRIKVIALWVNDINRAHKFYRETLALTPAYEGEEEIGYLLGQTVLMLKSGEDMAPTDKPNPRVTIAVIHASDTEEALRARGVTISDPVKIYDEFYVGSFLDSEGNKLWYCSPVEQVST